MNKLLARPRVWLGVVLVVLGGCGRLADSDAARVCRMLLPVLDRDGEQVEIIETSGGGQWSFAEQAIEITYRIATPGGGMVVRRISCLFEAPKRGVPPDPQLGVAQNLAAIVTEDGAIGPLRLHLLKQHWIAKGAAAAADPAPFATAGEVPRVPRRVAFAVQTALSALPVISIYALLAAAYALVYGLVGRINLAFGELTILAGYGAFLGIAALDASGFQGLGIGLIGGLALAAYTGLTQGAALGRFVLTPLAGRPGQHLLIATIGLSLFWSEAVRLAQGSSNRWIGPLFNRPLALIRDGAFVVTVTPMALVLPVIAGAAAVLLVLAMERTSFGRRWRAFADDPKAAALLGVDPNRLILTTMLAAAGCASLAGYLTTLYYGGIGFSGGQLVGLKALIAAVIGGIGSVPGALLGGVVLGLAEAIWSALFPIELRDPAIFTLLVVMLALRPDGMLGAGERPT